MSVYLSISKCHFTLSLSLTLLFLTHKIYFSLSVLVPVDVIPWVDDRLGMPGAVGPFTCESPRTASPKSR